MSIIASASVPAANRLIDAPTLGITALRPSTAGDDRYAEGYVDGLQRALAARPADCPPWCKDDHTNDPTDINGFLLGQVHERVFAELTGEHPAWVREQATAAVWIESTTEAGEVTTPARVVLSIAQGTQGRHPGEQDCEAWTGTPDEVRALAAVLVLAADLLDCQK